MLGASVEGQGERIVLVHGFTQTGASWGEVARLFAGGFEVVTVDLPGHGSSSDIRLGFEDASYAIGSAGGAGIYIGYSLGARLCLRMALDRPSLVKALVLVGGSPGLASASERANRRAADDRMAEEILMRGTRSFVDRWLGQKMFSTFRATDDDLEARRSNSPAGLAYALRTLGVGSQEPLWDHLPQLDMPVLALAGGLDPKYALIAGRMAGSIGPNAKVVSMPGVGHAAHLEAPKPFCQAVWRFLHPRPTPNRASSAPSGTILRSRTRPSEASNGSSTTSNWNRPALPRPQA
jgi:2-succinyl-6-hydroxy-2,4-cyclohexadiene-1-carboxylate synthase